MAWWEDIWKSVLAKTRQQNRELRQYIKELEQRVKELEEAEHQRELDAAAALADWCNEYARAIW